MLRLRSHYKPRIPNRLAVFAALMLVVSALVDTGDRVRMTPGSSAQTTDAENSHLEAIASESTGANTHKKRNGFKVRLFLFRSN